MSETRAATDATSHDHQPREPRDLAWGASLDELGSDEATRAVDGRTGWVKAVTAAVAFAFLVGAIGYFIGVRTSLPPTSAVDVGFLQDMTDHHDQAVTMSRIASRRATDPTVRAFAEEVILFQRLELGMFQAYLDERNVPPTEYDLDRITMAWMQMPTPLKAMPGMASEDQMRQLERATGDEVDKQFLTLMMNHHRGGVHMSEHAADHAADPKIRELARGMARNQRVEIVEYQAVLDRLTRK